MLVEQADGARRQFVPVDLEDLRARVEAVSASIRSATTAGGGCSPSRLASTSACWRYRSLTLARLRQNADGAGRASRYESYPAALRRRGFDPDRCMLVNEFPVTYLVDRLHTRRVRRARRRPRRVQGAGGTRTRRSPTSSTQARPRPRRSCSRSTGPRRALARRRTTWRRSRSCATRAARIAGSPVKLDPEDGQLPRWDPDERGRSRGPGVRRPLSLFQLAALDCATSFSARWRSTAAISETGLSEYLFPYELSFAIHPNGGSEFTIGGLRTVLEQNLDEVVDRAVENASCIYDPNCMVANRGADHGCLQLPETACQSWNRFISRWDLFGSPDGTVPRLLAPGLDVP